jgi:hypothetical protein
MIWRIAKPYVYVMAAGLAIIVALIAADALWRT